jgi:hypothetical protein
MNSGGTPAEVERPIIAVCEACWASFGELLAGAVKPKG